MKTKVLAMLKIKIAQRNKTEILEKKLAFEKFVLNRQNHLMEQLLTDNENLMDQI